MSAATTLAERELSALAETVDWNGSLARRLLAKVDTTGVCWEWTADLTNDGYGRWWYKDNVVLRAHRAAWALLVGPLPTGLQPDHRCKNRACINPDHIEWTTGEVNNLRSTSPSSRHARATHCPADHPYDETNTIWRVQRGRPRRECRKCVREQSRIRGARSRARAKNGATS